MPRSRGTVRALREPHPGRGAAEVSAMGGDRGAQLPFRREVAGEQRQIAVGGARGDGLDRAALLEPSESRHEIRAVWPHEILERGAVETLPARGQDRERRLAGTLEPGAVVGRGGDLLLEVGDELAMVIGVGELLAQ